jgi:DNA-binding transcriptional regulator LsrR (DeoR family)
VRHSDIRLVAKVARLYYEADLNQQDIARRLAISQAKVSRLLREARERDIVRVTVTTPLGVHTELEEAVEGAYGIAEAIVVDSSNDEQRLLQALGAATAAHLEATIRSDDVLGISSWSESLLATVEAMSPMRSTAGVRVVQILGGVGDPVAEHRATELASRLADLVSGEAVRLPVPGVVDSPDARTVLEGDRYVRRALDLFDQVTVTLVGVGALEPSPLLARSGNVFSFEDLALVGAEGGVGDVCLRFIDAQGRPVAPELGDRVIGMDLDTLRSVPRRVAVAGGRRKHTAIQGALRGGLVTHLITDRDTATALIA